MADQQESQTESASPRRLQRAFEEGNVALSRDLTGWATLATAVVFLEQQGRILQQELVVLCRVASDGIDHQPWDELLHRAFPLAARVCGLCAGIALVAIAVGLIQTRGRIWPELAGPRFERIFSGGSLRRLFGTDLLVDLGISAVKVLAIGIAIWTATRDEFLTLVRLPGSDVTLEMHKAAELLSSAVGRTLLALAVFAGTDFALSTYRHRKKLRMTKDELKREMKEEDGDPLLRSRRRRRHRELAKAHASVTVPRADALVVNPTHVAVALRYRRGTDRAPRVVAKGKGVLAEYMRELARNHSIPIVENITLARLLYRRVKIGGEVPTQTYQAVAAILAFVYRVTGRSGRQSVAA